MSGFVQIARLDCLGPGMAVVAAIEGSAVALFNVHGSIFALDDACVLCGSSLAAGALEGAFVSCFGCDWRYDVRTGCVCGVPGLRIDTYEVRTVGSAVLVTTPLVPIAK